MAPKTPGRIIFLMIAPVVMIAIPVLALPLFIAILVTLHRMRQDRRNEAALAARLEEELWVLDVGKGLRGLS